MLLSFFAQNAKLNLQEQLRMVLLNALIVEAKEMMVLT